MTQSKKRTRKRRKSPRFNQDAIERIMQAEITPAQLAAEMGMTLPELIAWSSQPDVARLLRGALRLSDIRVQMLLCKFRTNAALHLISIASAEKPSELSRKACVDLLRTELNVQLVKEDDADDEKKPPAAPNEARILETLEQLGEQA